MNMVWFLSKIINRSTNVVLAGNYWLCAISSGYTKKQPLKLLYCFFVVFYLFSEFVI